MKNKNETIDISALFPCVSVNIQSHAFITDRNSNEMILIIKAKDTDTAYALAYSLVMALQGKKIFNPTKKIKKEKDAVLVGNEFIGI